ncbi:MAG: hypothetical protein KC422_00705 [Trueperaceae bacterium]|nr:hypothetical protein [Trueperaceae bacterium]
MTLELARNALANIHIWTHGEGKGTYSARILHDCLLSLAGTGQVSLSSLSVLDAQRRAWLAEVVFGLEYFKRHELLSAAGIIEEPIITVRSQETQGEHFSKL